MVTDLTWPYVLKRGHAGDPALGACAAAAISWLVHGKHDDNPKCVSPVILGMITVGNDEMGNNTRQQLLPYLHRIAGSRSAVHEFDRTQLLIKAVLTLTSAPETSHNWLSDYRIRTLRDHAELSPAYYWERASYAFRIVGKLAAFGLLECCQSTAPYFETLETVLCAGPQGEPWSASTIQHGTELYAAAGGCELTREISE